MSTRYGTAHFRSLDEALRYYAAYDFTRDDVTEKIRVGEISIGAPLARPGQTLSTDSDGRYWITEEDQPREKPTYENQLWHARKLLAEKGRAALNNPHAMIGRQCGCGTCFCCAAAKVIADFDATQPQSTSTSRP